MSVLGRSGNLLFIGDSMIWALALAQAVQSSRLSAFFPVLLNSTFVATQLIGARRTPTLVTMPPTTRGLYSYRMGYVGGGTVARTIRFTSGGGVATFAFTPAAVRHDRSTTAAAGRARLHRR